MENIVPKISIVIPTYNRLDTLKDAISSIKNLNFAFSELEVIVVDDGSEDGTMDYLEKESKNFPCSLWPIRQNNAGPAAARNKGIYSANGEFIAFTDSDCVVDKNWLNELLRGFTSPEIAGVGGIVKALSDDMISRYFDFIKLYDTRMFPDTQQVNYLLTLNACYRKDCLVDVGGFNLKFCKPGGEDPEICIRLRNKGYQLGFQPSAVVGHNHKNSFSDFIKTLNNYGNGKAIIYELHRIWGDERQIWEVLKPQQALDFQKKCISDGVDQETALQFTLLNYIQDIILYKGFAEKKIENVPTFSSEKFNTTKPAFKYSKTVSIIINNYNYNRFLDQCIQSVITQTYKDLDIIIVDDGSTDGSKETIESFAKIDHRIQTVFKKNGGQASAFNAAFKLVKGDIICFLDADDYWISNKVQKIRSIFDKGNYSVVQHNLFVDDGTNTNTPKVWPNVTFSGNVLEQYFKNNHTGYFSATSGIACRRVDLIKIFPLEESVWRICADVPMTRPLPLFGEIMTLPECLGYYRVHDSNCWMGSERQSNQIENQIKYTEYTNECLARFGENRQVDFTKSSQYSVPPNFLIGPFNRKNCAYLDETKCIAILFDSVLTGKTMIDVGAHHGSSSMNFLDRGWKILAFEPDEKNRRILLDNLAKHQNSGLLKLESRAVSDENQKGIPFYRSSLSTSISSLHCFHETHKEEQKVATVTLTDAISCENCTAISFLKIDTEGHDLFVLKGFPWDRLRPAVIECKFEESKTIPLQYTFHDISDFLVDKGYKVYFSEWHPVGCHGVRHDWRCLKRYPCELSNIHSWGNILAFRNPIDEAELIKAFHQELKVSNPEPEFKGFFLEAMIRKIKSKLKQIFK